VNLLNELRTLPAQPGGLPDSLVWFQFYYLLYVSMLAGEWISSDSRSNTRY
jgi:hypothetical protein